MRPEPNLLAEKYRSIHPQLGESAPGANWGWFIIWRPTGELRVMSSGEDGEMYGWEHVSVSLEDRCPTWEEMCFVKRIFWQDSECVVQFHPPKADYINQHEFVLHLWRPVKQTLPMPPKICV